MLLGGLEVDFHYDFLSSHYVDKEYMFSVSLVEIDFRGVDG